MSTQSKAALREGMGGAPISKVAHPNIHQLVTLTSMHAAFGMETVNQWLMADLARQEAGTLDTIEYLTDSMRFLMTVAKHQQDFGTMCHLESGAQKRNLGIVEATVPTLKEVGMDTKDMEAGGNLMRMQSQHLEAMSSMHADNAVGVSSVIDRLEERIHAVLTGGRSPGKVRAN